MLSKRPTMFKIKNSGCITVGGIGMTGFIGITGTTATISPIICKIDVID